MNAFRCLMLASLTVAAGGLIAPAASAADAPEAKGVRTLFVDKGSASSVLKAMNKLHAKMEAEGWVYRDMAVYTEDGDLEGLFVTYVKAEAAKADGG